MSKDTNGVLAPLDPDWKALDFQEDVRPVQLQKLDQHRDQIALIARQMDDNNNRNLAQIDLLYKDAAEYEKQFIGQKMENMNLTNEYEMQGIKFLHEFDHTTRQTESVNNQINSIKQIIAMIQNELSLAETDQINMDEVLLKEKAQLVVKDKMAKENDQSILSDIAAQNKVTGVEINNFQIMEQKQTFLYDTLEAQQKKTREALQKQQVELDNEQLSLLDQESQLQNKVRELKQANQAKQTKNRKLEAEIKRLDLKVNLMENNIQ